MEDTPLSIATDISVIISSIVVTISIIVLLRRKKSKMSKEELDYWKQMQSDTRGYFLSGNDIIFEYNTHNFNNDRFDTVQNIKKIMDNHKDDYHNIRKFLMPYIRMASSWVNQKNTIRHINIEYGDDLLIISKFDFFKDCSEDNIKGITHLNDLISAIKKHRILQKKSRIKKLLHTIRNCAN